MPMKRTLVVYVTKYGLTEVIARDVARILGPARLCLVTEFGEQDPPPDFVLILTPVYGHRPDRRIIDLVEAHAAWLKARPIALACVCLAPQAWESYLKPLTEVLGKSIVWAGGLGGRIVPERLDAADRDTIEGLSRSGHSPLQTMDVFDRAATMETALQIKAIKDRPGRPMPPEELKKHVEAFLQEHNTCTLVTGYGTRVRGTPIEYTYHDGALYLLSEGGVKFANLPLNPQVSVAVYDAYEGMSKLGGMQMVGEASLIEPTSQEYVRVLALKGLEPDQIEGLPFAFNMIKATLWEAQYVWSGFDPLGYDVKQMYRFERLAASSHDNKGSI
jgi:menaquinone-dependent protoporphyrinogen IX oxidase